MVESEFAIFVSDSQFKKAIFAAIWNTQIAMITSKKAIKT